MNPDAGKPYGISAICRILNISRSSYYKRLHRKPTAHQLENEAILEYMIKLEQKNHYTFGVKRLTLYINRETPYHVSPERVRRLMRRGNIKCSIRIAKHNRKAEKKEHILENKLYTPGKGHNFHPACPNLIWMTDCSELTYGVNKE